MHRLEKVYCILAILVLMALIILVLALPSLRGLQPMLLLATAGLIVNIGLMYIIFKDLYLRNFTNKNAQFIWFVCILFVWPAVFLYLYLHGFRPRTSSEIGPQ